MFTQINNTVNGRQIIGSEPQRDQVVAMRNTSRLMQGAAEDLWTPKRLQSTDTGAQLR